MTVADRCTQLLHDCLHPPPKVAELVQRSLKTARITRGLTTVLVWKLGLVSKLMTDLVCKPGLVCKLMQDLLEK